MKHCLQKFCWVWRQFSVGSALPHAFSHAFWEHLGTMTGPSSICWSLRRQAATHRRHECSTGWLAVSAHSKDESEVIRILIQRKPALISGHQPSPTRGLSWTHVSSKSSSCTMGARCIHIERGRNLFGLRCCCKRYVRVLGRRAARASSSHRCSAIDLTKSWSICTEAGRWDVQCASHMQLGVHPPNYADIFCGSHPFIDWSPRIPQFWGISQLTASTSHQMGIDQRFFLRNPTCWRFPFQDRMDPALAHHSPPHLPMILLGC